MSQDPAIKLFGKTISLPLSAGEGSHSAAAAAAAGGGDGNMAFPSKETATTSSDSEMTKEKEDDTCPNSEEKDVDPLITPTVLDKTLKNNPSKSNDDQEATTAPDKDTKSTTTVENQYDSSGNAPQEKPPLKKPDKILPCPRCNSMDTKFCYYNNYNVNQPRHFCKKCQRYWTAGGTMRNVPVGAGRRKNKNTAGAALQVVAPDSIHHPAFNHNGTVLSFGSDTPLCESMASVLNLDEKTMKNCSRNGFHRIDEQVEQQSAGSSTTVLNSSDHDANLHPDPAIRNCQGFVPPNVPPYMNGTSSPWPYPWAPPPVSSPSAAAPTFCGSSFPIPIYPAAQVAAVAYWGCSSWSNPWIAPMPFPTSLTSSSGPISPTLGKHSRDGEVLHREGDHQGFKQRSINNVQENLWIPKTLRIDDPRDAAKSSIWATMGFNNDDKAADDRLSSCKGGGLFKAFENSSSKTIEHDIHRRGVEANSYVLHANPAALSRSSNFNESS